VPARGDLVDQNPRFVAFDGFAGLGDVAIYLAFFQKAKKKKRIFFFEKNFEKKIRVKMCSVASLLVKVRFFEFSWSF
jgi:hypothetical protein